MAPVQRHHVLFEAKVFRVETHRGGHGIGRPVDHNVRQQVVEWILVCQPSIWEVFWRPGSPRGELFQDVGCQSQGSTSNSGSYTKQYCTHVAQNANSPACPSAALNSPTVSGLVACIWRYPDSSIISTNFAPRGKTLYSSRWSNIQPLGNMAAKICFSDAAGAKAIAMFTWIPWTLWKRESFCDLTRWSYAFSNTLPTSLDKGCRSCWWWQSPSPLLENKTFWSPDGPS